MTYSLACCHKEYTAVTNTKSSTRVVETCVYPTPMTIVLGAVTETMQLRRQMPLEYCQSKDTSRHPIVKHKKPSNIPNMLDTIQIFPNQL